MSKASTSSLFFLFFFAYLFSIARAEPTSPFGDASDCCLKCALEAFSKPTFSGKTHEELCRDKKFSDTVGDCLTKQCLFRETMVFIHIAKTSCGIPPIDRYVEFQVNGIVMTTLAVVFFVIRILSKMLGKTFWGIDDTLCLLSMVGLSHFLSRTQTDGCQAILIPTFVIYQLLLVEGLGKDFETLPYDEVTTFFKYFVVLGVSYVLTLACIKASILFLYLQLFPDDTFRTMVKWTVACDVSIALVFTVCSISQAPALSMVWHAWQGKSVKEAMQDISWPSLVHACVNLALDLWMLILPMTQLYKLGLKLRKKMGVMAMFGVGLLLIMMVDYMMTTDMTTQNGNNVILWSYIELCVGVMVSCMPHTRQLTREITSRWRPTKHGVLSSENEDIFIKRSIHTIVEVPSSPDELVLHDKGNLLLAVEANHEVGRTLGSARDTQCRT
ncbi:hypothetical protein FSARC_14863 [Fusarium sarcochroum]|uniref:Rhodopsin domain-containing protein n=1 Tax=Fusarium sarcochroum TaxID=1208366 RepID=A0A8H4SQA5_9HYPO|nr:hypothetical protein FSARC_14863 [Fusarium sarcochroum]